MGENFTDVKCFFFISYRYISLILKLFVIKDVNIDENKIVLLEKYVMFAKKDITYKVTEFVVRYMIKISLYKYIIYIIQFKINEYGKKMFFKEEVCTLLTEVIELETSNLLTVSASPGGWVSLILKMLIILVSVPAAI